MADKKKISDGSIHVSNREDKERIDSFSETIDKSNTLKYYKRKNQKCLTFTPINMNDLTVPEAYNKIKTYHRSSTNISFCKQSQHSALEEDNSLRPSIQKTRRNMKFQNSLSSNCSHSTFYSNKTEELKDLVIELVSENIKLKRKYKNYKNSKILEVNNKPCKPLNLYSFVRDFKTGSYLRVNQVDRRKNKLN